MLFEKNLLRYGILVKIDRFATKILWNASKLLNWYSFFLCCRQWMSALCRHPQSFSNPSSKSASSIATQIISNRAVSAKTSASPTASFSVVSSSSLMAKESNLLSASTPLMLLVRGRARIYYQPSAWKRVNKHGLEKRLLTQSGIEVLWRRYLKDRHVLTPFERILSGTYNGQILPEHHLKYNQHLVNKDLLKGYTFTAKRVNTRKLRR